MENGYVISKVNGFLHDATTALVAWLEGILPRVSDSWWDDCVIASLSYAQREISKEMRFTKLADFDLAALLRIANRSWYDMRNVEYLPTAEREVVRKMIAVRNGWAHCSAELPGKDTIVMDLQTIRQFLEQVRGDERTCKEVDKLITEIERGQYGTDETQIIKVTTDRQDGPGSSGAAQIALNSLVYLTGKPNIRGVVHKITSIGGTTKYEVFVDGELRQFYSGQIAAVKETTGYNWVDADTFRSYLTAYQINNPSSQNLYSLNSARIDFVPYQFRPALKMIHADEPRILIADSVGVGKTIEAGLIIKELAARSELERVVVICPRPLVAERKWELEMKRFDEEFIPVDGQTLRQIISDTDRDGEWPSRYSKVILPYSILDGRAFNGDDSRKTRSFGLSELDPEPHFDLVIVDEAHHIRNGSMDKEKAFAYKCTKYFCDHADAVVMLTATPLQTSDSDLFTLLNVLRPDIVIDQKTFEMMARPNAYISHAAHLARTASAGWAEEATKALLKIRSTQWGESVIVENPIYNDVLIRLEKREFTREERVKLISDIEALHSFGTMINRTRRRDIQDFCVRRTHTISTEFTPYQQQLHEELLQFERSALAMLHDPRAVPFMMSTIRRQAASCIFGLAPQIRDIIERRIQQMNDDPDIDYSAFDTSGVSGDILSNIAKRVLDMADNLPEEDPKYEKILEIINQKQQCENNKIMVFSTFRHTLAYVRKKLTDSGYRVAQIDGSVKDETRYELKARFELDKRDRDAIDILLFTEVGAEGLDYQFCDLMINYDLPWNPMRIEQRIGRIDRRGQRSEAVNIYNIITENTVDADVYYRCLMRIGLFERSIGDCEEILGSIATGVERIMLSPKLTDAERALKLEQMADNEVRKVQEMSRLEEEERELFGFDLSEFTTSQEIRKAENPWLTQAGLQHLVEQYLKTRVGQGQYFLGEGSLKTLRLNATARDIIRGDLRKMPGTRNMLRRTWENYLSGSKPTHSATFDADTASKERDSFFITAVHPLAKQAAAFYGSGKQAYLRLDYFSEKVPAGKYLFSVFAWKYSGYTTLTKLITVCDSKELASELPDILETTDATKATPDERYDWDALEGKQVQMWLEARETYRRETQSTIAFKQESLSNTHRNRVRMLEQQVAEAVDDNIRRMRMSELENCRESFMRKMAEICEMAERADIYTTLLVNGVIVVREDRDGKLAGVMQ